MLGVVLASHCMHVCLYTGPPSHPHVVKTASIGTLGRTRTPVVVTVPNAPDVPETSKMLEDVDSVRIISMILVGPMPSLNTQTLD